MIAKIGRTKVDEVFGMCGVGGKGKLDGIPGSQLDSLRQSFVTRLTHPFTGPRSGRFY